MENDTKIRLARHVAKYALKDIKDKSGKPLFFHAKAVALKGKTPQEQIVGYLHDVLEDNENFKKSKIEFLFGKEIAEAVFLLTKQKGVPYQTYIETLARNPLARNVKLNDLEHNLDKSRWPEMPETYERKLRGAKEFLENW